MIVGVDLMKGFIIAISTIILTTNTAYAVADSAKSACVMNMSTGEIVFEKNAYEQLPMASTTKIMTAFTALKNSEADENVKISINAQNQEGSSMYAKAGDCISMQDMLYGLMLNSGNDAAVAIAEHISGDIESFADLMNSEAAMLGADNTSFKNPNGLHNDGHFTTAADLALIARAAMQSEEFRNIVKTQSHTARSLVNPDKVYDLYNHNRLLKSYDGAIGVKTGYTENAGRCLVSAAERGGMEFVVVTLNDRNDWNTHKELLDKAFSEHEARVLVRKGETVKELVRDSGTYSLCAQEDFVFTSRTDKKENVEARMCLAKNLDGAINKGEKVGYIEFILNEEKIGTVSIVAGEDIADGTKVKIRKSFFSDIKRMWRLLI